MARYFGATFVAWSMNVNPMNPQVLTGHDRWIVTGLVGAGLLTVSWWTVCAAGVWYAISWATT